MSTQPVLRVHLLVITLFFVGCGTTGSADTDVGVEPDVDIDVGDAGGNDVTPTPTACESNVDCRGGEVCREGSCREACGPDDPCTGSAPICDEASQSCVQCLLDEDCAVGTCERGVCAFDPCESDDDCEPGLSCDRESGICGGCSSDGDCLGGFTCEAEICRPIDDRVCTPQATRCEGNTLLTCSRDGTRETQTACGDDAICEVDAGSAICAPLVCQPDAIGCLDAGTAFVCNASGTATEPLPCRADQYCDAGTCRLRVCEPDTTTCQGEVLVECDATGATRTTTPCASFDTCRDAALGCSCVEDSCDVRICTPGTGRCVGALVQRCTDDGLRWQTPEECGDENICLAGTCVAESCTNGDNFCSGDTLLACAAARWSTTDCTASALLCTTSDDTSSCSARLCEPSSVFCDDVNTVAVCDARGAALTELPCASGEFCVDGSCTEVACDPRSCSDYGVGEARPDTDGDGIPDCVEGLRDTDSDGNPDCADTDTDGDGIPDIIEGTIDTDGDGIPDYRDLDSDNDTISDRIEGLLDSNGDGVPDRLSLDSDGDGWLDSVEAGRSDINASPVDTDGDGTPDYRDTDSDNDGIDDVLELGCPLSSERLLADSDSDRWDDPIERLIGSNPCDDDVTPLDFADVVWRPTTFDEVEELDVAVTLPVARRDIVVNIDTTGSMGGFISSVRSRFAADVVTASATLQPDVRWSVSRFEDFQCTGMGISTDVIFRLLQRMTSSVSAINSALTALELGNGGDSPESGYEALYQIATGAGVSACGSSVPAFNPATNRVSGVADGTIGGVGFRDGALPIVIHVTDASSRDGSTVGAAAATQAQTVAALQGIGARVAALGSSSSGAMSGVRAQMDPIAAATGATVPTCAWGAGALFRPAACTSGQCCTGTSGAGISPVDGVCPLVFTTDGGTSSVGYALRSAHEALSRFGRYTASARVVADAAAPGGFDTSALVTRVTALSASAPASCGVSPTARDLNADALNDVFDNAATGATLTWRLRLRNSTPGSGVWLVGVEIWADDVGYLDTIDVLVIAP